jgi:hypothetical protein
MASTLQLVVVAVALSACTAASADMERIASPCKTGICFNWWPKVAIPAGWQHDRDHSLHYNFNALAPEGKSFADAETVMYVNAVFRPRVPEAKTLDAFIRNDQVNFIKEVPDLRIAPTETLKTADSKTARSWTLSPASKGQWERVAYLEQGEYYIVFVISSRTQAGLLASGSKFEQLVAAYRE